MCLRRGRLTWIWAELPLKPAFPGRELGDQGEVLGVFIPHNRGSNPCCLETWVFHLIVIHQGHLSMLTNVGIVHGCLVFHRAMFSQSATTPSVFGFSNLPLKS